VALPRLLSAQPLRINAHYCKTSLFLGLWAKKLCGAFVTAVGSIPIYFAALIPVWYYCPSASLWAVYLFTTFNVEKIKYKDYFKDDCNIILDNKQTTIQNYSTFKLYIRVRQSLGN